MVLDEKVKKALWELYWFNFRFSLIHKIKGINFSRCFEYGATLSAIDIKGGEEILDIGTSNSSLPLFLAHKGAKITMLDVIDKKLSCQQKYARRLMLKSAWDRGEIRITVQDARKMDFPNNSFDIVTCISTIEHIRDDGDMLVIDEIRRILRPGGKAIISVPYSQQFCEENFDYYFQRWYDYQSLYQRIINRSQLKLDKILFFMDSQNLKLKNFLVFNFLSLPGRLGKLKNLTGFLHLPIFLRYMKNDKATKEDAWIAWISLKKVE